MRVYGDYYGIPHDGVPPVPQLDRLIKIRERYAYGPEHLFFDDSSLVGFTREGVGERPDSGAAVILTDGAGGSKRMYVGQRLAGQTMLDALGHVTGTTVIDGNGWGTFSVQGGSVSVWLTESALKYLYLNI